METKICTICGKEKEISFYPSQITREKLYTSCFCLQCKSYKSKVYSLENTEKIKERHARNYKKNREKNKEVSRKWKLENAEKVKDRNKVYYLENTEKVLSATKKWRVKNPEKYRGTQKKWEVKNPEKVKEWKRKWEVKNPEKRQEYGKKAVINMTNSYLASLLNITSAKVKQIDIEIISLYRDSFLLQREIKTQKLLQL